MIGSLEIGVWEPLLQKIESLALQRGEQQNLPLQIWSSASVVCNERDYEQ